MLSEESDKKSKLNFNGIFELLFQTICNRKEKFHISTLSEKL